MKQTADNDPLGVVASLLDRSEYSSARAELRQLERSRLTHEDQGRALAMEVLCAALCENERVARKKLWEAVDQHRDEVAFLHGTGLELAERGYFNWAEHVLSKACDLEPHNALGWYHFGEVLMRDERLEEAVEHFDRALECDSKLADAWLQRARCAADLGDSEAAADSLRRYLTLCPDDAMEWVSLAIVESDNGAFEAAYQAYTRAERVEPTNVALHFNWAITADLCGDLDRLRLALTQLERLAPDNWRTALVCAFLAEHEGELDEAAAALREARARSHEGEDRDYRGDIAAVTLRFHARYARWDELNETVAWIFAEQLFGDDVLEALREIAGQESDRAMEYQVVVEARGSAGRYQRTYAVVAETEQQAGRMACAFEQRAGGDGAQVVRLDEIGEADARELGVWWRDEEASGAAT